MSDRSPVLLVGPTIDALDERLTALEGAARPPRETYVRVTIEAVGYTVEPAVEFREGDDFESLARRLEEVADLAVRGRDLRGESPWPSQMDCASYCGFCIREQWPDRAYFVEVWQGGKRGFAQVFQPFGVPRNR